MDKAHGRNELSLEERAKQAREASEALERDRHTWGYPFGTASNSSCDTRCDTPDEEPARPEESRLRSAIRNALGALAPRPPEDAEGAGAVLAGAGAAVTSPGEPGLDGGGPVPRLQDPVDLSDTAQATRMVSLRLTEDDYLLVEERCREHGLSRSDYIRQLMRADAVTGETGMRRVLVLDRTSVLSVAKEMRAWGRHYNQAVHALNVIARYLRGHGDADDDEEDDIAEALASVQVKLDGVERGRARIEERIDELCCLGAIRGK